MTHADFVHLRVHSSYSLAEGAIHAKDLVKLTKAERMPAVSMTDTGNMFGALEFAVTASDEGIQPIVGVQLKVRRPAEQEHRGLRVVGGKDHAPDQLLLLVQSEIGYRNVMAIISRAYMESTGEEEPQIEMEDLEGATDGLIALTASVRGAVGRLLIEGHDDEAEAQLLRLARLFPDRLYIELQRHFEEDENRIEGRLVDLAYTHALPLVATNEVFFADESMHEAHDVLLCIAQSTTVGNAQRRRVTRHHRFKTAEEMRELFSDLPEAVDNTVVVAQRCAFMPERLDPILPRFETQDGRSEAEELRTQAEQGLAQRLAAHVFAEDLSENEREATAKPYRDRLEMELGTIEQMGFPGYFLIVSDFIKWAKAQAIPVGPGRGSGAGSLVAYSLLITDLDPLRWGLLFERFLNPERVSMPDFDIDFCQDRRDEVIRYVQEKYGRDRVAQIITFGKLQARAALRDVGRVLEMPYGQVDRICKLVPNNPAAPVTLAQAMEAEKDLQRERDQDETVANLIRTALQLEGLYRNSSTHAAGVVIGDRPLSELVPLYRDPRSDMPVTQFNMKWVEQAGLVKFDFLGLKTLTVLQRAIDLLGERGIEVDLSKVPLDDAPAYAMLAKGESTGVFQLESSGMRDVLRRLRPDRFEDIIALVALYRPGPMANIPKYIACKHGQEQPDYMHPVLEPVLKETFGIMIYQEQVQQAAQRLSGYTLGGADLLRRAMGKKIKAEMDAQRDRFVTGAVDNGVDEDQASAIFDQIAAFAGYGFNKSHAAAYALVAYHTAYMKANHPVEFLAASMTYDMANTDKLNTFRQELQKLKISLLPPDINRSRRDFAVERMDNGSWGIRYALAAIKNVGGNAIDQLVEARERDGPFKTLADFADRVDPQTISKRLLENMVRTGTFDALHPNRAELFDSLETVVRLASAAASERGSNQVNMFALDAGDSIPAIRLKERAEWPVLDRLKEEFDALGFYLSAHPLDSYTDSLRRLNVTSSDQAEAVTTKAGGSTRLVLAGIVVSKQIRTSRRGNRFAFVQMTDRMGVFEVTLFSEALAVARDFLDSGEPLLIRADAKIEEGNLRLLAAGVELLDKAAGKTAVGLEIFLHDLRALDPLKSLIANEGRGRGKIRLVVPTGQGEVQIALPEAYQVSARLRGAVKALPGIDFVRDL
ncbi:MAG: DNA polymerase III subunit alpha [Alphaproteobacteria bacterium]|nr:DNA polymerase III subunit alpha [Alphaproteobacteria bacterium]